HQRQRRLCLIKLVLRERNWLVESVGARRLEARFLELLNRVSLGFSQSFAAGVAPFQRIVRQIFHVRPPRVAIKVGNAALLRSRSGAKRDEQTNGANYFQGSFHRFHPRSDLERIENSKEARNESRQQRTPF